MKDKNFLNSLKENITEFDSFNEELGKVFLEKSYMLGINNFEKIFKMH